MQARDYMYIHMYVIYASVVYIWGNVEYIPICLRLDHAAQYRKYAARRFLRFLMYL